MQSTNIDQAEHYIALAIEAKTQGRVKESRKLLRKSLNFYPSQQAKDFLDELKLLKKSKQGSGESATKGPSQSRVHKRRRVGSHLKMETPVPEPPDYSLEQLAAVKKIINSKDNYDVLGITKCATNFEIRNAYKKLAKQIHPDKNKAPGADEAFKKIKNAFEDLTYQEPRYYDFCGSEQHKPYSTHSDSFETYCSNLYTIFFGNGIKACIKWMLLLFTFLFVLSMILTFFEPIYSFQPSSKYSVPRKSRLLNVLYYVKDDFEIQYQGSIDIIEANVERDYINSLKHYCNRERDYKEAMIRKAQEIKTPYCDTLHNLPKS